MVALSIRGTLADSSATFVRRARPKIASKGPKTLVSTGGLCAGAAGSLTFGALLDRCSSFVDAESNSGEDCRLRVKKRRRHVWQPGIEHPPSTLAHR